MDEKLQRVLKKYPKGGPHPVRVAIVDGNVYAGHPNVVKEIGKLDNTLNHGHASQVANIIAECCPSVEIIDCVTSGGMYEGLDLAYEAVTQHGAKLVNESYARESIGGLNIIGDALIEHDAAWIAPALAGGPARFDNPSSRWHNHFFVAACYKHGSLIGQTAPTAHNITEEAPSWACARLTGYIALMLSFEPDLTFEEIDAWLRSYAVDTVLPIDQVIEAITGESLYEPEPAPIVKPEPAPEPDWESQYKAALGEFADTKAALAKKEAELEELDDELRDLKKTIQQLNELNDKMYAKTLSGLNIAFHFADGSATEKEVTL
jgi:hypothetical protein